MQPNPSDYSYDIDLALRSVVAIRSHVPADAFTAETLGTERAGNGVVIDPEGIILTIGYLIAEAEMVWIGVGDGRAIPGFVLAYDHESGFGLVRAGTRLSLPALTLGSSSLAEVASRVVVGGVGGREQSVAARIVAKQEFAGYWEYLLDEALFTAPSHPNWGGTAVIDSDGRLIGIGSLQVQHATSDKRSTNINMIVPIDVLKPIYQDLLTIGRPNRPPRPWLGLYATEMSSRLVVAGISSRGPSRRAGLQMGDVIMKIADEEPRTLASLFRKLWSLGSAGVEVPLVLNRDGTTVEVRIKSADRRRFLKGPVLH